MAGEYSEDHINVRGSPWTPILNEILYALLLIPYLESWYWKKFYVLDLFFKAGKLMTVFICAGLLILERRKYSKLLWSVIVIQTFALFATVVNPHDFGDVLRWGYYTGSAFGCTFLAEYFMPVLREKIFSITRDLIFILVLINTYTVIAYPQGMYDSVTFFLGLDNRFVFYMLPMICMAVMYSLTVKHRLDFMVYASLAVSLFCTIATWAVGGFIGMIFVTAGIIFSSCFNWFNNISTWLFFLTPQIASISLTIMRIQYLFRDFIVEVLKKDITFTGRTTLWDKVLSAFSKSPVIGMGIKDDQETINFLGGLVHAHNEILDHLFRMGLLGMAGFCLFWVLLTRKISRIHDSRVRGLCNVIFFVQLFMALADTIGDFGLFYLIYVCMYHYSSLFERDKLRLLNA